MLEAIVAVMISISLMAIGSRYISQQADSALNQATARQLNQLSLAANHYAHDHFEQLQAETKEGQWVEWQRPEIQRYLIDKGYLPDTLPGKNPYQQQYRIIIQQPELQLLQIVTLTQAGKAIKESSLRQIAQVAGPNSGFISHLNPQQVMGSQGGWELPLTATLQTPPGHLAALHYLSANEVLSASSLLFRKKIAGHDNYNKMETALKMAADIELEDGTKIWFNSGKNGSTVIENGRIELTQGKASVILQPELLAVNTSAGTAGTPGYYGIKTNSHVQAEGDVIAGHNIEAKHSVNAESDINARGGINARLDISTGGGIRAGGDIIAWENIISSGNINATGSMNANAFYETPVGYNIADIPLYQTANNRMYDSGSIRSITQMHCSKYPRRLFMVEDNGYARHLLMCLLAPGYHEYWILATGYYKWGQGGLHRVRPAGTGVP